MASDLIASSPPLPQHELDQLHNSANFGPDVASPVLSGYGSQSVTSDNVSMSGLSFSLPSYMTSIQPRPCYASRESASRAATELYRQHKELGLDDDSEGETDRVLISETATGYVNSFLDKLLHDILANAQSTQLPQLRSATADVLRRTLGKEAVAYADANLEDLLAAEPEDDTEDTASTPTDSVTRWDLEYIWKRARLRVMMRSENSDFDIDDDEHHAQEAGLSGLGRRFGDNASAVISLHGEIFLAGVLDFVSDHVFAVAIIPASMRRRRTSKKSPTLNADPTVLYIDETDLEKGVLNSPLDRHWRAWRKSTRSRGSYPTSPRHGHSYSDTSSPETTRAGSTQWGDGPYHNANTDLATPRGMPGEYIETPAVELPQRQLVPEADYPEHVMASNIPLPIGQHDVDEIETPGLAKDPEDKANMLERPSAKSNANLRNSLGITTFNPDDTGIPTSEDPSTFGTATVISQTYARSNDGHMAVNPDTVSALIGDRSLEGSEKIVNEPSDGPTSPHPERTSSLVNPISSPTSTTKRNREAAVGMGFPNGISLPQELPANEARSENISEKLSTHDDPRLRAASPSSETEGSEVMSPRDFMAARNLQGTRSARSDSAPQPVPTAQASPRTQIPSPLRSRLQTSGLQDRAENSPVSPLSASELGTERPTESSKYGAVAGAAVGERGTLVRKTSAPAARVTDDLARARGSPKIPDIARGSPKMRQTSLQDRESLRRIAVERNGSLVSLVDETSHKPRNKTPLTSSSIVSAEDFDSLLNGSDTIKMTLSPSSVRESPVSTHDQDEMCNA
ncbi:hypothetical protein ANO11243_090280 [Dothideomycetidae sp. 11243]|nr:hypothetical protein ANO11243_090280 [fungal sp. No.11243]